MPLSSREFEVIRNEIHNIIYRVMNQLLAATYVRTLAAGKRKMIEAILRYLKIAQCLLFLLHFIRI